MDGNQNDYILTYYIYPDIIFHLALGDYSYFTDSPIPNPPSGFLCHIDSLMMIF